MTFCIHRTLYSTPLRALKIRFNNSKQYKSASIDYTNPWHLLNHLHTQEEKTLFRDTLPHHQTTTSIIIPHNLSREKNQIFYLTYHPQFLSIDFIPEFICLYFGEWYKQQNTKSWTQKEGGNLSRKEFSDDAHSNKIILHSFNLCISLIRISHGSVCSK